MSAIPLDLESLIGAGVPLLFAVYNTLRSALMARGMTQEEADVELVAMLTDASAADDSLAEAQQTRIDRLRARIFPTVPADLGGNV